MSAPSDTPYDEVRYPSWPYRFTHPAILRAIGRLHGLEITPLAGARVLELGCGAGGNLVPMALWQPGTEFVGLDLAHTAIDEANELKARHGVTNATFLQADVSKIHDELGTFDFIVAHGLYSWVPGFVREAVLDLFESLLTPTGIGVVSYNNMPGWSMVGVARTILKEHARRFDHPLEAVDKGIELIKDAAWALPENTAWRRVLLDQWAALQACEPNYVVHDYLAPENNPFWFRNVHERLSEHGLTYVTDAELGCVTFPHYGTAIDSTPLPGDDTFVQREFWRDILSAHTLRRTVFAKAQPKRDAATRQAALPGLYATKIGDVQSPRWSFESGDGMFFRNETGTPVRVADASGKALLKALYDAAPKALPWSEIVARATSLLEVVGLVPDKPFEESALFCYDRSLLELRDAPLPGTDEPSERPVAWDYVRIEAARGTDYIANPRHIRFPIKPFEHLFLPRLDGTRDLQTLAEELLVDIREGRLDLEFEDEDDPDLDKARPFMAQLVTQQLDFYRSAGLLCR